jgi:hypothetical protein
MSCSQRFQYQRVCNDLGKDNRIEEVHIVAQCTKLPMAFIEVYLVLLKGHAVA